MCLSKCSSVGGPGQPLMTLVQNKNNNTAKFFPRLKVCIYRVSKVSRLNLKWTVKIDTCTKQSKLEHCTGLLFEPGPGPLNLSYPARRDACLIGPGSYPA
ncbi:unnamed protein product [Ixodes pacificus]